MINREDGVEEREREKGVVWEREGGGGKTTSSRDNSSHARCAVLVRYTPYLLARWFSEKKQHSWFPTYVLRYVPNAKVLAHCRTGRRKPKPAKSIWFSLRKS